MPTLFRKHLTLMTIAFIAVCLLVGSGFFISRHARAGDLGLTPAEGQTQVQLSSVGPTEVYIEWAYLDADRVTVEYTLTAVSEEPRGVPMWTCPIRRTLLVDSQGRKFGTDGTRLICERTAAGTYRVVQDFFQHTSADCSQIALTLQVVIDLKAHVLPDGSVTTFEGPGAPVRNVLDDEASLPDAQQETHVLKFSVAFQDNLTITESQQVENNGRKAVLRRVEIAHSLTKAELCLDLPDAGDWQPQVSLAQGAMQGLDFGWEMLDTENPLTFESSHRCYRFTFPFVYRGGAGALPLHLRIERLVVPPSEGEVGDPARCAQVHQRLVEQQTGIEVQCQTKNGVTLPEIVKMPGGMTKEMAHRQVRDAYSRIVEGPWEFEIAPKEDECIGSRSSCVNVQ